MTQQTPLYQEHLKLGAKIVDFGGWDMPLHYGSQLNEHHFVRKNAGIFDVSHMTVVDVSGSQAFEYLRYLLANDVTKLNEPGKALYSCMLNAKGGVIDDLIVYFIGPGAYRVVVNASTRDKDLAWMMAQAQRFSVELLERRDLAMIAVQGPQACIKLSALLESGSAVKLQNLRPFSAFNDKNLFIARTGYTGEDGVEIILPVEEAAPFWQNLIDAGFAPCGLGARDTLRLEAGLNLYGSDMDETTTPFESNLSWTVSMKDDRDFIGREALEMQKKTGVPRVLVGLISHERGAILRGHQKIYVEGGGEGEITSGTFSPTLNKSVALGRIPATQQETCMVDIRGKRYPVQIVKPPFIKQS
jgi:aminomethyltransferase